MSEKAIAASSRRIHCSQFRSRQGGLPFILVLTGLPTLFPKLNEARTYTERMFEVFPLDRLTEDESREAITIPVEKDKCPLLMLPVGGSPGHGHGTNPRLAHPASAGP